MSNCSQLLDLYTTVAGRLPLGIPVTLEEKTENERRLVNNLPVPLGPSTQIRIPDVLVEFARLFGGEKTLTQTYYNIFRVEDIIGAYGHIVFASDPRSGLYFGLSHHMLRFEDPDVVVAPRQNRNDVFGWRDYSESLDDCLVEFACYNLCSSMPYILHVENTDVPSIQSEVTEYPSIVLTQSGESGSRCQSFYAPGTVIYHQLRDHSAMIGMDTIQRALAFQDKHKWGYKEVFVNK